MCNEKVTVLRMTPLHREQWKLRNISLKNVTLEKIDSPIARVLKIFLTICENNTFFNFHQTFFANFLKLSKVRGAGEPKSYRRHCIYTTRIYCNPLEILKNGKDFHWFCCFIWKIKLCISYRNLRIANRNKWPLRA